MLEPRRMEQISRLLCLAKFPTEFQVQPIPGGRNNKVYRVSTCAGHVLFKIYFHHPRDPRDRLAQEFAFLRHLESSRCRYAAKPLAALPSEHVGLMEFIEGNRPSLDEIDEGHINRAIEFFLEANRNADSTAIGSASEACFSIDEHIDRTQVRVDRLEQIMVEDEIDKEAVDFVRSDLMPLWSSVRTLLETKWPLKQRATALSKGERVLSPSDFGFHNSLRDDCGRLRFVDFEYAGWDDPAKLIADFANQPDMLLDERLSRIFREALIASSSDPAALEHRVEALVPLYQIKWSCICLNDFLAFGRTRHRFTEGETTQNRSRRLLQLERARVMLARAGENECSLC